MKNLRILSYTIACFIISSFVALLYSNTSHTAIAYYFPLDQSRYVKQQTSIIIRSASRLATDTPPPSRFITITGSLSGEHTSRAILAKDRRTMIFRPDTMFTPSEEVTVRWSSGMPTAEGDTLNGMQFTFSVAAGDPGAASRLQKRTARSFIESELSGKRSASGPLHKTGSVVNDTSHSLFPQVRVQYSSHPTPGGIYWSNFAVIDDSLPSYLLVTQNDGSIAYSRQMDAVCIDFFRQPNGYCTYFDWADEAYYAIDPVRDSVAARYTCTYEFETDQHDICLLPNGHVVLLGKDPQTVDMSAVVPGGMKLATVIGLVIQEFDEDGNLVFQWRSWDHFAVTDAVHEDLTQPMIDAVHANAIDVDTDGNILLSSRHLDEITKIDRVTGGIIWRWGGLHNQFTFLNDSIGFSHQHDIRRIANGNLTLFDNGNYHTPPFSRACEYKLDEANKTATLVWQYKDSLNTFSSAMGNVQRLDNGNTIIGWGASSSPGVTEVTPNGVKTFEMSLPENVESYRAFRFDLPTAVPVIASPAHAASTYALEQNYPNPFNPSTTISYSLKTADKVVVRVFDALGRIVQTLVDKEQPAGSYAVRFDASENASGIYFCQLATTKYFQVRKMILMK